MNKLPPKALKEPFILHTDYVQGAVTGIDFVERNPEGDWTKWLPTKEPQKFRWDTNECSSISTTKCIEIQLNFLRNEMTIEALTWFTNNGYIDENGNFNLSERFQGIMAGTSIHGNSQNQNWETVRKVGILPQKDLSYSMEQSMKFNTQWDMCEDYYNPDVVTEAMKAKAKLALRYILIQFEWAASGKPNKEALTKALKQAPLQIGTPVCPTWNTGDVLYCGDKSIAHATTLYKSQGIFDHYNPYTKTLSPDYYIPYAVKGLVTLQEVPQERTVSYGVLIQFIELLKRIGAWTVTAIKGLSYAKA